MILGRESLENSRSAVTLRTSFKTANNALLYTKNTVHSTTNTELNGGKFVPTLELDCQKIIDNYSSSFKRNKFSSNTTYKNLYTPLTSVDKLAKQSSQKLKLTN